MDLSLLANAIKPFVPNDSSCRSLLGRTQEPVGLIHNSRWTHFSGQAGKPLFLVMSSTERVEIPPLANEINKSNIPGLANHKSLLILQYNIPLWVSPFVPFRDFFPLASLLPSDDHPHKLRPSCEITFQFIHAIAHSSPLPAYQHSLQDQTRSEEEG